MGQNNKKVILGGILIKIILVTRKNIYLNLVYLKGHPNNYLVINGKYHTHHLLFNKR
jgi:hypothetical protein